MIYNNFTVNDIMPISAVVPLLLMAYGAAFMLYHPRTGLYLFYVGCIISIAVIMIMILWQC